MIVKGKDVLGLSVFALKRGKRIADIEDLIYDPREHKVKALLVDEGGWFADAKVILFTDVENIGSDAVMVASPDVIRKASEVGERIAHIAREDTYLTKTKIVTENGTDLGRVTDIYFDDKTGAVEELEVSQGLKDMSSGRKRVRVGDIVTVGEDATIVRAFTEEMVEEQAKKQGLAGAVAAGAAKASEAWQGAKERVSNPEASAQAQDRLQQVKRSVRRGVERAKTVAGERGAQAKSDIDERRQKSAIGKYVTINILSKNDEILAHRGDMITHRLLELAEQEDALGQVLSNVSDEPLKGE